MTKRKPGRRPPSVWESSHVSEIGPHRLARLTADRERLARRLSWADRRGDHAKVERLERQLAELDDALAQSPEDLEGSGRATDLRRRFGDDVAELMLGANE